MSDPAIIVLTTLGISFAMFVHGYAGFGLGMVGITLLSFIAFSIERLSVVLTLTGIMATVVLVLLASRGQGRGRGRVRWKRAIPVMAGNIAGAPLGYLFILRFGDQPVFSVVLGILLVLYMAAGTRGWVVRKRLPGIIGLPVGLSSGFIGGAFASGGPIIVMYLYSQVEDPRDMKATIQVIFFTGMFSRVLSIAVGPLGLSPDILILFILAVPFCIAAMVVGHVLSKRHSSEFFSKIVYTLVGFFGLVTVTRGMYGLFT